MKNKTLAVAFDLLVIILAITSPLWAIDYYIDQSHPAANDQNVGVIDRPWKTIIKANQTLTAGDTVYIKAGTYTSYISPNNSGSSTKPIIYINYGNDIVTISNTIHGIYLDGKSYIAVQGINFYNLDKFLWLQNGANYNTIAYCNFDQGRSIGWSGSKIYRSSSYNWVHHCRFSKYGYYTDDDIGAILDIGNEKSQTDISTHNIIENNVLFHGGHHVLGIFGMYNVIRNNYIHNENWSSDHGNRNIYLAGYPVNSGWNLIEGNQIGYSGIPPDNYGASGMALTTQYNIIRRNRFYHNNLNGIAMGVTSNYLNSPSYNKVYNNTFLHNGFNNDTRASLETLCGIGFIRYSGKPEFYPIVQNAIKNNIFHLHRTPYASYARTQSEKYALISDQIYAGNWEEAGDPKFINASATLGDPFNPNLPDLHLRENSPCIDAGVFLTTITSANGSGETLQVQDARYFIDGWGIVEGDLIQIEGAVQKIRITHVNYLLNEITVDKSISWTQNQGVSLAYELTAPDIGAYEAPKAPIHRNTKERNNGHIK